MISLTPDDIVAALKASDPEAFISEQETGWYVIDGRFDLRAVAETLGSAAILKWEHKK